MLSYHHELYKISWCTIEFYYCWQWGRDISYVRCAWTIAVILWWEICQYCCTEPTHCAIHSSFYGRSMTNFWIYNITTERYAQHDAKYFWKPFVWALPIFSSLYSLPPLFNNSCNKSCGVGWKSAYHNHHCWNKWCESTRFWYQVSYWHKHLCMLMHDLDRAVVRLSGAYGISWKSSFCTLLMNSVCEYYVLQALFVHITS